jgi:type III restriction enzyme
MKLRFDPHQPHQREAIDAVVGALGGPPTAAGRPDVRAIAGSCVVANVLPRSLEELQAATRAVQSRAGLPPSGLGFIEPAPSESPAGADPSAARVPALSLDLETGTGKTYAFVRCALELSAGFGLRKFLIVVPSVAIREGVLKTLQVTQIGRAHV